MARLGGERRLGGASTSASLSDSVDPNYQPNYGAAGIAGVRNAASGLAGLGDLAYMAGDYLVGDDPVQSEWDLSGKTARAFDPMLPTPGWEPTTTGERFVTGATEAGTAFLVPGAGGVRYISQAPKLAKGLGAFGKAATQNYGKNAARLGGANLAASQAGQYAQSQDMGTVGQIGLPMAAAMIADPATGLAMSMRGRNAARGAAQAAVPQASKGSAFKLFDLIQRKVFGRLGREEITHNDVVAVREMLHSQAAGRSKQITNDEIRGLREAGDEIGADMLQGRKNLFDNIIEELDLAIQSGRPLPTTAGVLGGADVQSQAIRSFSRRLSAESSDYAPAAVSKNEAARDAVAREALDLAPGKQGTTESVRETRDQMMELASEDAADPWSSGFIDEVLDRVRGVRPQDVRSVINNAINDMNLSPVMVKQIGVDDIMEQIDEFAIDGSISAREFNDVVRTLVEEAAVSDGMTKTARKLKGDIHSRMRSQLERRIREDSPGDYEEFAAAKRRYREFKETYDPEMTRNEKRSRNMDRLATSKVAEALGTTKGTTNKARSYLAVADSLSSVPGDPEDIAMAIRRVMRDDPDALAEVEQNLWRSLLGDTADTNTTSKRLGNQQRELDGVIDLDDEGKTLAIYRALAGDEKADAVPEIVKAARQARNDPAGTNAEAHAPGSNLPNATGNMALEAAETVVSQEWKYRALRGVLKAITPGSSESIEKLAKQAYLDPVLYRQIMDIPDGEAFKEWRDRWASRTASSTARESVKRQGRKKE